MKKVININFQGRVIPIEETAYDILKQYIETLSKFFANEEGGDEIINDIEGRIAELFGESLKKGSTCITDDDVNAVIASIGKPEDFEGEETKVQSQFQAQGNQQQYSQGQTYNNTNKRLFRDENSKIVAGVCSGIANYFGIDPLIIRILFVIFAFGFGFGFITYLVLWVAVPSSATKIIGSAKKRLLRDPDDKIIAGVCRGLSHYFGVNVWIPRILFLIPFISIIFHWSHWGMFNFPHFVNLSFSPGATLMYIILWLVLPEAQTTSEKLEMKGEKVDLNSIKNTITSEMKDFQERIPKMAKDIHESIPKRAKEFSEFAQQRGRSGIGNVIALFVKIVVYFIVGVVLFAIVSSLFALGVVGTGLLPLKHYLLDDKWQTVYAWGVLILFIWIPIIAIVVWIIRRISGTKTNNNVMRYGFSALWVLGLFCVLALAFSLRDDFKYHNYPVEENVQLTNPKIDKLEIKGMPRLKYYGNNSWLHLEPFANIDADTAYVRNIQIRIIRSNNDSFNITTLKLANGSSKLQAEDLASKINYNIVQEDSVLMLDKGIAITAKEKFRNQKIYISIAVPLGKRIEVDENAGGWGDEEHVDFGWDMNDNDWEKDYDNNGDFNWSRNVEYVMTKKGLQRTDGQKENVDENDDNDNNNADTTNALQLFEKSKAQLEKQREREQKHLEQIDQELQKAQDSTRYHYQPEKPATPKKVVSANEGTNQYINISSVLMERFIL